MSLLLSASKLLYNLTTLYLVSPNPATLVHLVWSYLNSALALQLTRRCLGGVVVPGGKPFRCQTKPGCGSEFTDTQPWAYFIVFNIIWSSWNQTSALVLQLTRRYLGDVVFPEENLSDLQTRPGYVSGLSPQSSVFSRHSGDVAVRKENLPDT